LDKQPTQLQDKVQLLIEQYTKDKKRLAELEVALSEKNTNSQGYVEQINSLKIQLQSELSAKEKLTDENNGLKTRNLELEKTLKNFESFAEDISNQIDGLIPKIDKL
jgi:chromosome segregation ATPase